MNNEKLNAIIHSVSNHVEGGLGRWQFQIDKSIIICLTDEFHNRMRFISPIDKLEKITSEQIHRCMSANFHTALDTRYAFSEGMLWSAFIHPLKELTQQQVLDGISQVYSSVKTFGSSYSSSSLIFPTKEDRDAQQN